MKSTEADKIREQVRSDYAKVADAATDGDSCGVESSCCGVPPDLNAIDSTRLGYSDEDLQSVPEGANMGLGCGNPGAIASINAGETVLDLGSGGGFDCFLAAKKVESSGQVIGVDMTPSMVSKARKNAEKAGFINTSFRLGEIEYLPVENNSIDVIISNCVINLSPDKQQVFNEAFRVLKAGGRLAVADVVASVELPESVLNDLTMYSSCIAGASTIAALENMMLASGFEQIIIEPKDKSKSFIKDWVPDSGIEEYVLSASITAIKPKLKTACC